LTDFERVKFYYTKKWATKEQVGMYCFYKVITHAEYYLITGDTVFLKSEVAAGKLSAAEYESITGEAYVA